MRKWNGVENYILGIHWYAFSDINKNGKPELIVKYGGVETDAIIWVYEYKGGKDKKAKGAVYETWYPSLYNYTSGNGLVLQERGISEDYCETVTLVTLSKGRIKAKIIRNRYFNSPKQKTTIPNGDNGGAAENFAEKRRFFLAGHRMLWVFVRP